MRGMITLRDVLANLGLVRREFGAMCVVRCLFASVSRSQTTFLEIALRSKEF